MFTTMHISPLDLHLDERNPRFRINVNPSQEDIRKYMINHEKVLVLANSMTDMNTLLPGERVIIFHDGEKNIVLEGNRRTCVYQMLLNRNLIPLQSKDSFPIASKEFLSEIYKVPVDVVNSRQEAMAFLAARHIVGVERWSSVSKWKISYEYFLEGFSINQISNRLIMSANTVRSNIRSYKILLRGVNNPIWTEEERVLLSPLDIKPDKLIRILGLADTTRRLGLYYSDNYDLVSSIFKDESITKLIILLTKFAFITKEINTRTSINDIWHKIVFEIPEFELQQPEAAVTLGLAETTNNLETPISDKNTFASPTIGYIGNKKEVPYKNSDKQVVGEIKKEGLLGTGGKNNLPYFFDGLQFGHLDRDDIKTHGVTRVCEEIRKFSSRKLVDSFPVAAAFLTRALIEQSIIYYSKSHNIQGQSKLIWEKVCEKRSNPQLSDIIKIYNRSLTNYITDFAVREYFETLFSNYNTTADPLNWVVHRPHEFVLSPKSLLDLPGQGLLAIINYMIS